VRVEKDIMLQWLSKPAKSYEEFKANTRAIDNAYTSGEMGILSGIAPPSYSGYTVQAMKCDSQRGLCAMALAATAYKAVNGQYPKKGEDLVPKYMHRLPVDQFNRKPLKMKTLREGLDLYSVGPKETADYSGPTEPIHFYLGREAYDIYRVKPAQEKN